MPEAILPGMKGSRLARSLAAAFVAAAMLLWPETSAAKRKRGPTPTPAPTPTPPQPTPTPGPALHKAAGSCLRYEAGAYVMLVEVGQPGRAFRIDSQTDITARPRRGARLRILYVDAPEGPVARKIMPGPAEETTRD